MFSLIFRRRERELTLACRLNMPMVNTLGASTAKRGKSLI